MKRDFWPRFSSPRHTHDRPPRALARIALTQPLALSPTRPPHPPTLSLLQAPAVTLIYNKRQAGNVIHTMLPMMKALSRGHAPAPLHPTGLYQSSLAEKFPLEHPPAFLHQVVSLQALDFTDVSTAAADTDTNSHNAHARNFDLDKTILVDGVPLLPYTDGAASSSSSSSSLPSGIASVGSTGTPRRHKKRRLACPAYVPEGIVSLDWLAPDEYTYTDPAPVAVLVPGLTGG